MCIIANTIRKNIKSLKKLRLILVANYSTIKRKIQFYLDIKAEAQYEIAFVKANKKCM